MTVRISRRPDRVGASLGLGLDVHLRPPDDGRTRMLVRNRGRVTARWLDRAYLATMVPADHVIIRGMLTGLQERVAQ